MSDAHAHRLTIQNDLDDVEKATLWLHEIAEAHALPPELVFRIDLCLAEAVTNVISYAFPIGEPNTVDLDLRFEGGGGTLTITDAGRPFNPLAVPEPSQPKSLDEAPIGGLGVHLIRHYADDCAYDRQRERNVLTLYWRSTPSSRGSS